MDEGKIKNFEELHGVPFPSFRSLGVEECKDFAARLESRFSPPTARGGGLSESWLFEIGVEVADVSRAESFDIAGVVRNGGCRCLEKVFVDWGSHRVDEMSTKDLSQYFDDIWYPSSDDILVFDSSIDWALAIFHYGAVLLVKTDSVDRRGRELHDA